MVTEMVTLRMMCLNYESVRSSMCRIPVSDERRETWRRQHIDKLEREVVRNALSQRSTVRPHGVVLSR